MTQATQLRLRQLAVPVLQGGLHVVLDATFLQRTQRDAARQLAAELQVPFRILDFPADAHTLRRRVRQRALQGGDPSEADEAVLQAQMQSDEPLQPDERAVVFSCRAAEAPPGVAPQVDWQSLLAPLAADPPQPA
jgi:predicted kinase